MDYEERELILELFPGTPPDLLPLGEMLYWQDEEGQVHIEERGAKGLHLVLEPVGEAPKAPQVCEACRRHLSGQALGFFRTGWGATLCTSATWSSAGTPPAAPAMRNLGV